jgi:hypothetical protein
MKLIKKILFVIFCLSISYLTQAQNAGGRVTAKNTNGWYTYSGDHKIADKWGVHLEFMYRRNEVIAKRMQWMPRVGINYHFNNQAFATVGYVFVETYAYGNQPAKRDFPEHRIYEQVQYKSQIGKFELTNRMRLEQRFITLPLSATALNDTATFTNRFRYQQRVAIPFKGDKIVDKSFYFTVADEFFINFGKNVKSNLLDQNRAYFAIGYKIPKAGRLEIGYLNQRIVKGDGKSIENNNTFQIGLSSNIDFYKKKEAAK